MTERRGSRFRTGLRAAALAALLAATPVVAAQPAGASSYDCTPRTTAQTFAKYGDLNHYFLVPDGTFENGTASWALSGGAKAAAQRMSFLSSFGTTDKALVLPAGAKATSPTMCVASNEDSLRFFYKAPALLSRDLEVTVTVSSSAGTSTQTLELDGSKLGWQVSPRIMLPNVRDQDGRQYVTLTFTPTGRFGTWYVDDVQIDPWRTL